MTELRRILGTYVLAGALALIALSLAAGCGGGGKKDDDMTDFVDNDGDGFAEADGDCNDENRSIHPDAPDPCDGVDQNCDGVPDEDFDQDEDGWTSCSGDCRDNDPDSNPGMNETVDGLDNDCDGIADNHTDQFDDDGDGYSEDQGDCNDDPDGDGALIGPDAIEVAETEDGEEEGIDNDCDGEIDESLEPCQSGGDKDNPTDLANSIEACYGLLDARISDQIGIDPRSRGIFSTYGDTYTPHAGDDFIVLSTGIAGDRNHPAFDDASTSLDVETAHPDPQGAMGCSSADPDEVNDYTELELVMQVPQNAKSFSFDFNFMSIEFPEFVCSSFDDTFLALLQSQAFNGNVSFDAMGNRVSINVGFFDVCDPALDPACTGDDELMNTGYENTDAEDGGGTGWLTTTSPVVPGEKVRIKFTLFDEGDHILDSAVIIDNFRWEIEEVDGPVTVE